MSDIDLLSTNKQVYSCPKTYRNNKVLLKRHMILCEHLWHSVSSAITSHGRKFKSQLNLPKHTEAPAYGAYTRNQAHAMKKSHLQHAVQQYTAGREHTATWYLVLQTPLSDQMYTWGEWAVAVCHCPNTVQTTRKIEIYYYQQWFSYLVREWWSIYRLKQYITHVFKKIFWMPQKKQPKHSPNTTCTRTTHINVLMHLQIIYFLRIVAVLSYKQHCSRLVVFG